MADIKRLAAVLVFTLTSHASARADTTVSLQGIGTRVGVIDTHADSVTYSDPVVVTIPGVGDVNELRGTVSGVGWGGNGVVARAANAHYNYDIAFVARWRVRGGGRNLVMFHHGGGPTVIAAAQTDRTELLGGPPNRNRLFLAGGDYLAGVPALLNHAAYIGMIRNPMREDRRFQAKYVETEVPPLTQTEVDLVYQQIGKDYTHPEIVAGAPVLAAISVDTATFRDVDRAMQQLVAQVSGTSFRNKISIGTSAGAILTAGMAFGCAAVDGVSCVRLGDNHYVAYDSSSPRIFDGYIFNGFPYRPTTNNADPQHPFYVPTFFVQGRGDDRYQFPIQMAAELEQKGVKLDGNVWIYEVANMPHITRDNRVQVPVGSLQDHAEANGPYNSAAIRNLLEFLDNGTAPPKSRIAGRIVGEQLVFDVAGGTWTEMPVREDPTLDTVDVPNAIVLRTVDPTKADPTIDPAAFGATERWRRVTAALPHDNRVIVGPTVACRVAGYKLRFIGAFWTPFLPEQLAARFGSFGGYRACVSATLDGLDAERLYDPRVENATEFASLHRALFAD